MAATAEADPAGLGRSARLTFTPKDMVWIALTMAFLANLASFALSMTLNDHFYSWLNWPEWPIESAAVGALRPWILRSAEIGAVISALAGLVLGRFAVRNRPKPALAALGGLLLLAWASGLTQQWGQDTTTADVQRLPPFSLALVLVGVVWPLVCAFYALRPRSEKPAPPPVTQPF